MHASVITPELLEKSRREPVAWGFNGLGEFVFHRTYVRKDEPFADGDADLTAVLARVTEGTYQIQRERQPKLRWDEAKARASAAEMFDYMRKFYFLPPGRGLWMMGTDFVHGRNVPEALNNCAFASTQYLKTEGGDHWRWFAEMLMLGVGVGTDTRGAGVLTLGSPSWNVRTIVIADTRQGWGNAFRDLWDSYQDSGADVEFDFSLIRPAGSPIKGFGGVASGPEPLRVGLNNARRVLALAAGKPLTARTITDFGNIVGRTVVAGNVRRSAEIILGRADDLEFLNLKSPESFGGWDGLAAQRPWYWLSNNSVMVEEGDADLDYHAIARRIYENGEPGIVWLDSARKFGRMGEELADWDVEGTNPCSEQQLGHREMCTLVEVFPNNIPDLPTYIRVLKYAYLYAKTVTIANDGISDDISRAIMQRNLRIGQSDTGLAQFVAKHGLPELERWWTAGYDAIQAYDDTYSRWFGVPRSIRTTSIKPSGTVALLPGATPGVHYPISRFYERRVDLAANSALVPRLRDAGYELEESASQPGVSYKVVFPVDAGEGVRSQAEVSLIEQIDLAASAQRYHSDNMVSFTATFSRETTSVEDIAEALAYARTRLKSISMLPAEHGYVQAPYTAVDEASFNRRASGLKPVSYAGVYENEDAEKVDAFCETDSCEIREFNAEQVLVSAGVDAS